MSASGGRRAREADEGPRTEADRGGRILSVAGRRALVTGAAGGLGAAIARALAAEGADVAVAGRFVDDRLRSVARDVVRSGRETIALGADIADETAVNAMVSSAASALGGLDILVANAGIMSEVPFHGLSVEEWDRTIEVNLRGVFLTVRAAIPLLLRNRSAAIVTISSQVGQKGAANLAHYAAAKGGVLALTRSLALEYASSGLRVNCVAPGPVETPMLNPFIDAPAWRAAKEHANPLGRLGRPEEVAAAVVFLASDAASFFVGQTLYPNGGGLML